MVEESSATSQFSMKVLLLAKQILSKARSSLVTLHRTALSLQNLL